MCAGAAGRRCAAAQHCACLAVTLLVPPRPSCLQPAAAPRTLGLYAELADAVWHAAGDTTTDLSWWVCAAGFACRAQQVSASGIARQGRQPGLEGSWRPAPCCLQIEALFVVLLLRCRYTKRAALVGVYSATELYMLTDCSPGACDRAITAAAAAAAAP